MRRILPLLAILCLAFAPAPGPPKIQRVAFRMEDVRWVDVFRWLGEQTGKPFVGSSIAGSFTFVGPPGARYTIPEILAIMNRNLQQRGIILVERPKCFVIEFTE
jgi:hypothetical protein